MCLVICLSQTLFFPLTSLLRTATLDPHPPPPPDVPVKALHSTLDGRHWALDDPSRASRRSVPPSKDPSRAPSKPRASHPPSSSVPPRVLFPSDSSRLRAVSSPSSSAGGDDTVIVRPLSTVIESQDSSSSAGGDDSSAVHPLSALVEGQDSFAIDPVLPSDLTGDDTILFHQDQRSFIDDFLPPGVTSSHLLSGTSAVTGAVSSVTGAVLTTTAAAVRSFFPTESSSTASAARSPSPSHPPDGPSSDASGTMASSGAATTAAQLPSVEQFLAMQRRHDELQRQLDDLVARQTAEQRAKSIDDDIEKQRKAAYEQAGLPYVANTPHGGSSHPPVSNRHTEYRISHKSIDYLRPADASHKPFEAVDGEVYVRPLAWLAHLKTKLELRDDFHFKSQVLQVASECLLGRAAAWWTAIGQRMRNILLTDYSLELWHSHIQVLCQSREQTRKFALSRQWQVNSEECWDYVWDKAALFEELDPRDRPTGVALISDILDGLPAELAWMCRTEFSPNPTVSDLTKELQVLVPRWKRDLELPRRPLPASRSRTRVADRPRMTDTVFNDGLPDRPISDCPSLSVSYDKSKIETRPHPLTRRMTRCFTKPNGKVIYLSRNCSRCNEAHFDFEHDSIRPPPAIAHLSFDEMGYEQWGSDIDSDTANDDAALSKKLN